jgi:serine/threonine protein kinase
MTQNNTPKAKPEDVATDTDRSPLENESKTEPAKLESDNKEAEFLDSFSLMDAIKEVESAPLEPDNEEADFFDGITLTDEAQTDEVPAPEHDADTDPDHEETAFFDSGSLLDELQAAEPSQAEPEPDSDPDHDETVFFDSGSLLDELQAAEPSPARPGRDHIEDAGGEPPLEVEAETVAGKEPTAPAETKKFGNYEVVKLLGTGGFGSVWQATAADGLPVAVKVLNPDILDNERAVRKFFHEAINLSKMNHPHICRFIDFFPQEGNYAIVMDFVQGTDLQDLLKEQGGPLPFETARQIAAQALDALHYAHQKQVLHRDIKPENITLTTEGAVKIMDFGIARLSSSESQQTSLFMISPAYTAPERFDETKTDDVDQRADIYSLGLVFYEIFTGKHPFPTTNPMEMIMAHLNTVPPPPDEIADLPKEISNAILKALEKNPEDRFEDFAAFKMEMLGEAPIRASDSIGPLELSGESCKDGAALLKTLSGIVKKHQKQARKITVGQVGEQVNVIIETTGGNELCITRDI